MTHPRRSKRQPETLLNDLDIAVDISLLESNIQRAQSQLSCTVHSTASVSLMINTDKTEHLFINCPANQNLTVSSKTLKKVEDFRYLGSMVGSSSADFKRRWSRLVCFLEAMSISVSYTHLTLPTIYSV